MSEYTMSPAGDVAFRCDSGNLWRTSQALYREAMRDDIPEEIGLRYIAAATWYEDLAADLIEIQALPEVPA